MSEIKVTTSDLFGYARRLSEIAGEVGNISSRNYKAIQKINDSCSSFQSWSFINMENRIIEKFTDLIQTLNRGTSTAMNCAYAYEEANTELINSYSGWFGDVGVNTIGGSTEAYDAYIEEERRKKEKYDRESEIIDRYNNGNKIDIDNTDPIKCGAATFYFEWGCTWYAAYRFKKVTGIDLEFLYTSGNNATNWDNNIDTSKFDVKTTSDINNIVAPSVAVKESSTESSTDYGHVVFIEAVRDGKVYFSEGDVNNPSIAGSIECKSIEEFMADYQSIITAK